MSTQTGPVRIGNCSGFYGDRIAAMREMLSGGELDVLTGDYLAELTMLILGRDRLKDAGLGYAKTFYRQLEDCLGLALEKRVRIVANAGGLNPLGLAAKIRELAGELGLEAAVAAVDGDDVLERKEQLGVPDAITANAYLGGGGITRALAAGADVVVTGRVTDAALTTGPAAWWHGWEAGDPAFYDAFAGAMAAGHVIECSTQATGGNYAFFARDMEPRQLLRPGFPIAEVAADGSSVICKHEGTGGLVSIGTVSAQLLYEVAGPRYPGPDATLRLDSLHLSQEGPDRVRISGAHGEAPPADLKVSTTTLGGFRNEMTFLLTGLDIEKKAELAELQLRDRLTGHEPAELEFRLARTDHPDSGTEAAASAQLTVVAWDPDPQVVGRRFADALVELALASYPGATFTAPPGRGGPYGVYEPAFLPATDVEHRVHLPDGTVEVIPPSAGAGAGSKGDSGDAPAVEIPAQPTVPVTEPTMRVPLGEIAAARSGDKGGDANIGVWVDSDEAYTWLLGALTTETLRELLPEAAELEVERYELPNLRAINFVVRGILGRGVAHGFRFDPQAKGLGEWLRSREMAIPVSLVEGVRA